MYAPNHPLFHLSIPSSIPPTSILSIQPFTHPPIRPSLHLSFQHLSSHAPIHQYIIDSYIPPLIHSHVHSFIQPTNKYWVPTMRQVLCQAAGTQLWTKQSATPMELVCLTALKVPNSLLPPGLTWAVPSPWSISPPSLIFTTWLMPTHPSELSWKVTCSGTSLTSLKHTAQWMFLPSIDPSMRILVCVVIWLFSVSSTRPWALPTLEF